MNIFKFIKDKNAQGSIEIILIIAGVILVALIVGFSLKKRAVSVSNTGTDAAENLANKI